MQFGLLPYETLKCELPSALKPQLSFALTPHSVIIQSRLVQLTQPFMYAPIQQVVLLRGRFADLHHCPSRQTVAGSITNLSSTSLQRSPVAPIMSNPKLISYLEGMKKTFWHERRHLQQEEIKLQWAAKAAPLASILFNTEAPTQPMDITSTQGQQMARQSTSKSWTEAASARGRAPVRTQIYLPLPGS